MLRVAAYGSRALTPSEQNYNLHSGKLEFLALKWAIFEHFRTHLFHAPSFVCKDHYHVNCILATAKLNTTGKRWVAELADFFTIPYMPEKGNADVDRLSRMPPDIDGLITQRTETVSQNFFSTTQQALQMQQGETTLFSALSFNATEEEDKEDRLVNAVQPMLFRLVNAVQGISA